MEVASHNMANKNADNTVNKIFYFIGAPSSTHVILIAEIPYLSIVLFSSWL